MKKITLMFMLFTFALVHAQPSTNPAAPTNDPADVISVYGDTYTNVATNYDPNWGQSGHTQVNPSYDPGTGQLLLAYPNFNYQGTELTTQNAAAMEFLHIDIWTNADPSGTTIQVSPINNGTGTGETLVTINYTQGAWTSVDIPKSDFTGMTWDSVFQMKFAANGPGSTVPVDIYLDNIYFWKAPVDPLADATLSDLQVDGSTIAGFSPGTTDYTYELPTGTTVAPQITMVTTTNENATTNITQASGVPGTATVVVTAENGTDTETYSVSFVAIGPSTAAPTPPNRPASDVISIYSDAYSDVTSNFDAGWCGVGSVQEVSVDGNATQRYLSNPCQGIDFAGSRVDATSFTNMHIDFYTSETNLVGKVFNLKLVNFGPTGNAEVSSVEINLNDASSPAIVSGSWVSLDVPVDLSGFTGLAQAAITSNLNGTVWYDNFYVHKNTTLGANEFEAAEFKVFPNPTNNKWNITSSNIIKDVAVYDILGKEVLTLSPNSNETVLDASSLRTGIYMAKIEGENGTETIKLVKN